MDEFAITLITKEGRTFASVTPSDGSPCELAGEWCSTPEAALVNLADAARRKRHDLANTPAAVVRDKGLLPLYVWLSHHFT